MSNYRDGLFYSYFGLSGPGGPMVSDIIFAQSLLTIRLGLVLTWSHGLCNFVSLSSLLNLALVSLGLIVPYIIIIHTIMALSKYILDSVDSLVS